PLEIDLAEFGQRFHRELLNLFESPGHRRNLLIGGVGRRGEKRGRAGPNIQTDVEDTRDDAFARDLPAQSLFHELPYDARFVEVEASGALVHDGFGIELDDDR